MNRSIFLSYARADAATLAKRIRDDLVNRQFEVWLDREFIQGGDSWTSEIERGIDGSQAVLAILTPGSFVSDICRAEQMRALRKGKRVIPLLAQKEADRPLHLEHLNYRDFSSPESYLQSLEEVLSDVMTEHVPSLPDHYTRSYQQKRDLITVPPLPPNFVARVDLVRIRQALTSDAGARITGIHGMGGVGKTVLAQSVCHDGVIQDAFPDGIVWLGMATSGLLEQLREAGRALGDDDGCYDTLPSAMNGLRTALQKKAVLLVLDDVVEDRQLEAFRTDAWYAPRVRILFTARDQTAGLPWAAEMVTLGSFSPESSVEFLRKWTGREDPAFGRIAQRVANLPLALKVAGTLMAEGMSGEDWLVEVQHLSDLKLDRYSTRPENNVTACFDLSLSRLPENDRQLYSVFGALLHGRRIPFPLVARLWRNVDPQLTDNACKQVARAFARRALVELDTDRVTLHDLLHEYSAGKLADSPGLVRASAQALTSALEDANWVIRERAADGLARIGDTSAVGGLMSAAAGDDDMDVRLAALRALAHIRDPRAIEGLIDVLVEGYYETTLLAAGALAEIGEPAVLPLISSLGRMWTPIGLQDAISALEWIGDPRALPALEALCGRKEAIMDLHTSSGVIQIDVAARACGTIRGKLGRQTPELL